MHVSSARQSLSLGEDGTSIEDASSFIFIDILYNAHSDIPPPHDEGQVFSTTLNIWPTCHLLTYTPHPVLESTNRYSILTVHDTDELSLDKSGCRSPPKPTKRPASSSSQANTSIEKVTTISSPVVTMMHQSRPPLGEFQAAVMHARSDGAEQAPGANCDQAALLDGKAPPRGSSRATSSEGIAIEGKTSPGTERNARRLKSKSPRTEASTKTEASQQGGQRTVGAQEVAPTEKTPEPVGQGKDGTDATEAARRDSLLADPSRTVGLEEQTLRSRPSISKSQEGTGRTGKSICSAQVKPAASARIRGQDQGGPSSAVIESHPDNSSRYRGAEERKEAASTQVVERGHQVAMIEVPDEEDDTAYQWWLAKGSPIVTPTRPVAMLPMPPDSPIQIGRTYTDSQTYQDWQTQSKVTSPTVVASTATNAKAQEVSHQGWIKPLSVDWTLRNVQEACSNNAACAQLVLWMHKDQLGELTDDLLEELQIGGTIAVERLYELREPIRYICGASGDFSVPVTLEPVSSLKRLTMKALIDSGCTGDMLGIRLPVDFAIFYQLAQSTSGTESYSEGFTLIASIRHKIVSNTVSEQT